MMLVYRTGVTLKILSFVAVALVGAAAATFDPIGIRLKVDFGTTLRDWDGFGVNYVEAAQSRDYDHDPQEYGGLSILSETDRNKVLEMTFGADGLKPGLLKMFLDPWHERSNDNNDPNVIDMSKFDHTTSTRWMRLFAREGLARTRRRGDDLTIVTTLYCPPGWMTKQGFVRGRDLRPDMKYEVAEYIISWARFLRETEKLPVRYVALHNEGEDWTRWPDDGSTWDKLSHDYNLYWSPEQVADFVAFLRPMLDRQGMTEVGVAPGETTNWLRFHEWGYADAIAGNAAAMRGLGLITSHGFVTFNANRWFADWRSIGTDTLREKNPRLHAWVTSQSWNKMDVDFLNTVRGNIYVAKVNGVIPWAAVQRPSKWVGGDPNPGTAFNVSEDGKLTIQPGYYYYKQVSRAGQPGMAVAQVSSNDTEVGVIAFASRGRKNPDAFVVLNMATKEKPVRITIAGSKSKQFAAYRTSAQEQYSALGASAVAGDGTFSYTAPARSATTFFAQ